MVDELGRVMIRVDKLEQQQQLMLIKQEVQDTKIGAIEKNMDTIQSNTTWILRLIIGFFVLGVLGIAFNFDKLVQ